MSILDAVAKKEGEPSSLRDELAALRQESREDAEIVKRAATLSSGDPVNMYRFTETEKRNSQVGWRARVARACQLL